MTGTLFVLGIALLSAAFIGGGLKVSNVVEIPVISTRVGGFGLALVGLFSIGLGYQFHYWETHPGQRPGSVAVGSPTSNPPAANTQPSSAASPSAPPPDPNVFYAGTVRFDSSGLNFDLAPPRPVYQLNIQYLGSGLLYTTSDAYMAQWDQQEQPDKAGCAQQVDKQGENQVGGLIDGAIVCLRTKQGRIGRFDVQSAGSGVLTVYATVWKD